jgi:hypothetical protein
MGTNSARPDLAAEPLVRADGQNAIVAISIAILNMAFPKCRHDTPIPLVPDTRVLLNCS